MTVKISEMDADAAVGGLEMIPVSDAGTAKRINPSQISAYTIDLIEAIAAGTAVTGADSVYILQGGVLKPADIDLIAQHGIDTMWGKAAVASVDAADVLLVKDGGTTEKTATAAQLATYVLGAIEASILDISNLADGSSTIATSDMLLVTQSTTGKRVTIANVSTLIYASLAATVTAMNAVSTAADADLLYSIQGGTGKKLALSTLRTYLGNPPTAPATTTTNNIPQWSNTTGAMKDGLTVATTVADPGVDTNVPTEQAVREALTATSAALKAMTINDQSGTTYTLALADQGAHVRLTNGSAITLTVPTNASIPLPIGSVIRIVQGGAGQVTVAGAGGVVVNTPETLKLAQQYSWGLLVKVAEDTWDLSGELEASA